jgi:hypothetical protein
MLRSGPTINIATLDHPDRRASDLHHMKENKAKHRVDDEDKGERIAHKHCRFAIFETVEDRTKCVKRRDKRKM